MAKEPYPSETADRFIVRFPGGMRDRIREAAEKSGRSMNAEIIHRLGMTFQFDEPDEDAREDIQNIQQAVEIAIDKVMGHVQKLIPMDDRPISFPELVQFAEWTEAQRKKREKADDE